MRQRGRGPANPLLGVRAVRTDNAISRVGFAVPKKVGTAVVRNRVRRRLRAIAGALPLSPGWDIVIAVRPPAAAARFDTLAGALRALLARHLSPSPARTEGGGRSTAVQTADGVRSTRRSSQRRPIKPSDPQAGHAERQTPRTSPLYPPAEGKGTADRGPQ